MRPIHLQIAGLQSYREAQEIDFTELTGAGVFGIFGPTGSGKSTLLDAMTLALYGKVERANGGTQAIMNQAEQSLSVSFTFELTSAEGPKRYRVDRQFKRGGDVSVLGSLTRLIHFRDGEAVVLADKAGEVNSRIQEILGLAMADFTRAVVLPQGKFAEFLTLAGKDRRAMLQRLFHLEPYGDRLSAKTSGRLKETDVKIRALQAEQQGLGDASKEALEAAEARLLEAREAARTVRERLADCERRTAELRAVRELQRERAALAARQAALAADAPRIAALAARLARAAQAERLRPLVRRQRAAEAHLAQQREAAQAAAAALGAAQQALAAAQQRQAAAQGALAAQEAPLAARLEQLRQAAELAAELAQGRERLAALAAEGARCGEALAALGAERTREAELREKALQRQAQLKAELKQAEVPSAYRTLLQEAVAEKRELGRLAKQLEEQTAELAKRQSEHEALERRRAELKERRALEAQRRSPAPSGWLRCAAKPCARSSGLLRRRPACPWRLRGCAGSSSRRSSACWPRSWRRTCMKARPARSAARWSTLRQRAGGQTEQGMRRLSRPGSSSSSRCARR
ncbi:RecF/RecN/SMC N-terminal domain protein [Paenibacillus mucilaginosus 3016]|uniref:Nuclease SbcCD subunit C n=1 Tax=Paenibacillus mucilaginosus 3016 TaxID=1116391 RepID=H6NIF8_9BACL|nr:RecF/RecN/SMC N-terminal domain protein [Paenibacillus mucilaginosus 3016]